jgi:hypothetical protein
VHFQACPTNCPITRERVSDESEGKVRAVHEVGHAVVAWAFGLKVQELRIGEHGEGASVIEHDVHFCRSYTGSPWPQPVWKRLTY